MRDFEVEAVVRMRWRSGSLTEGETDASEVVAQEIKETLEAVVNWASSRGIKHDDSMVFGLVESHVNERLDALARTARPGGDMAKAIALARRAPKEVQSLRDPTALRLLIGMDVQLTPY